MASQGWSDTKKDVLHSFKAKNDARFLVADLHGLPESATSVKTPFAIVSRALKSFCMFADIQLTTGNSHQVDGPAQVVSQCCEAEFSAHVLQLPHKKYPLIHPLLD